MVNIEAQCYLHAACGTQKRLWSRSSFFVFSNYSYVREQEKEVFKQTLQKPTQSLNIQSDVLKIDQRSVCDTDFKTTLI